MTWVVGLVLFGLLAVFVGAGIYAAIQQHRHGFAVVLAGLGYKMQDGQLQLARGSHRVEAPSGPFFDLVAPVTLPRVVSPRQSRHGTDGQTGDPAFDEHFFVGVAEPWAFHGLSGPMRDLFVRLASLGEVHGGPSGVRVRLQDADRLVATQATDLLVAVCQAATRHDLERIVRSDSSHRVATGALRALHETQRERAEELALAVGRRSTMWRREKARILRDVPAIAAFLDDLPTAVRLVDQLNDEGVAEVLATCMRPVPVLLAFKRSGVYDAGVPPAIRRAAWRALRRGIQERSLPPFGRRELVPVWMWARDQVVPGDAEDLGSLALHVPHGAVPSVIEAMEGCGLPALPVLQSLEHALPLADHKNQVRLVIHRLTEANPERRGGLALAERVGGDVSVAEPHESAPPESA